ncbi:YihY/virulence factor BrkB family protein [Sphingosinicellaceae bacterium]|nr:YihY/virulence factor BrkB family protein [Sphingosinicellaceae bacterium]
MASTTARTGSTSGRDAATPLEMPARGWWQILKRTYVEAGKDNLDLIAAGVAFYGFLAMVPLLGAMVLTYGLVVDPADLAKHMHALTGLVPGDAAKLIDEQLVSVAKTAAGKKGLGLALALALALYGAMKGAGAVVTALNVAYEQRETRGFIRTTMVNAAVTLAAVLMAVALLLATSVTGFLEDLARGLGDGAALAIKLAVWAATACLASAAVAALYRYAPARTHAQWHWLTPGSVLATLGLVLTALGFGFYAANFGNYNATYGSLGAVVVLLLWLYLSAYVLLLGAEFNAELEHQTERDTTAGDEKPMGQRGAKMADEVAAEG